MAFKFEVIHSIGAEMFPARRYAVQHVLCANTGDPGLDEWGRGEKLFPWVAVAAQVDPLQAVAFTTKPLPSTLSLPMKIRQPLFMHALWAIAPDCQ
jgi:hypothetical protein